MFRGESFHSQIGRKIIAANLTRTIEGASTLEFTIHDPQLDLVKSRLFESRFDVEIDGLWFRLVQMRKGGRQVTLTFEDREVSYIRGYDGPVKAYRDQMTRAEFVLSLIRKVREQHIKTYILELHKKQPIEDTPEAQQTSTATKAQGGKGGGGLSDTGSLTVKSIKADSEQIKTAQTILAAADEDGASNEVKVGLITAAINESTIRNLTTGDSSSIGVFQLLDIHGTVDQRMDIARSVHIFVTQGFTGAGSAEDLSQKMGIEQWLGLVMYDANGTPYPGLQYIDEARKWVEAWSGGSGSSTVTTTKDKRYAFEIDKNTNYWDGIGELASEVQWKRYMSAGIFYYVAEEDLMRGPIMMNVSRDNEGIIDVDFDWDQGKAANELTVTANVKHWAAPPGTVIYAPAEFGPAQGRYLVTDIKSDLFTDLVTITCNRPTHSLPEPAPDQVTKTTQYGDNTTGGGGGGDLKSVHVTPALGAPHWGGSADVMEQAVYPIAKQMGLTPGATKEGGHTPGGDHDPAVTNAFATDFPTTTGEQFARAVADLFGDESIVHTYNHVSFQAGGYQFSAQVLWDLSNPEPGPGDYAHTGHVHVGIRRA